MWESKSNKVRENISDAEERKKYLTELLMSYNLSIVFESFTKDLAPALYPGARSLFTLALICLSIPLIYYKLRYLLVEPDRFFCVAMAQQYGYSGRSSRLFTA